MNKCAEQCTNKKQFPDSNLLSAKKICQLKENLRGWNSQMKSKSVNEEVNEKDNNSNVNLITIEL